MKRSVGVSPVAGDSVTRVRLGSRFFLVGLIASLLAACQPQSSTEGRLITLVEAQVVRLEEYAPTITLTGVLAAADVKNLSFRVGGRVISRLVDTGDRVTAGQLLAELDSLEQQADLRSAEATVAASQAQVTQAKSAFVRQEALFNQGLATRRQYDEALQSLRTAEASLKVSDAQLELARQALDYVELRADVDGIVLSHGMEAGQVVQAAQTTVTIAADGDRDAVFNVDEGLVAAYSESPDVSVTLLGAETSPVVGKVREISPAVDAQTGTVRVKVTLPDTPSAFTLGAPVVGQLVGATDIAAVLPWKALIGSAADPGVWVVDPQTNIISRRSVTVTAYTSDSIVVSEGLTQGEVVVTSGAHLVKAGQEVNIRTEVSP